MEKEEVIEQFNDLIKEYPRNHTKAYELDPSADEMYDIYTLLHDTLIEAKRSILWTQKAIGMLARSVWIDHAAIAAKIMPYEYVDKDSTSQPRPKPWEQD